MVLLIVLVILVIAALMGVWGLSTTRLGFIRAGHFRGSTKLLYNAEDGLKKATLRLGNIATNSDSIGTLTLDSLLSNLPSEDLVVPALAPSPPDCPEEYLPTNDDLDRPFPIGTNPSNVVCNFMGKSLKATDTQVILVRKEDQVDNAHASAVFLLNSISRDITGRKKVIQGVVVIPYEGGSNGIPFHLAPGASVVLATTLKTSAD